jgi:hypothetical protein
MDSAGCRHSREAISSSPIPLSENLPWTIFPHPLAILLSTCHANLVEMSKSTSNSFRRAPLVILLTRHRAAVYISEFSSRVWYSPASHRASSAQANSVSGAPPMPSALNLRHSTHSGVPCALSLCRLSAVDYQLSTDFLSATVARSRFDLSHRKQKTNRFLIRNKTRCLHKYAIRPSPAFFRPLVIARHCRNPFRQLESSSDYV